MRNHTVTKEWRFSEFHENVTSSWSVKNRSLCVVLSKRLQISAIRPQLGPQVWNNYSLINYRWVIGETYSYSKCDVYEGQGSSHMIRWKYLHVTFRASHVIYFTFFKKQWKRTVACFNQTRLNQISLRIILRPVCIARMKLMRLKGRASQKLSQTSLI